MPAPRTRYLSGGVGRGNVGALFCDNVDHEIRPTFSVRGDTMCHSFMVPAALTGIEPQPNDARRTGVGLVSPLIIKRSGLTYCPTSGFRPRNIPGCTDLSSHEHSEICRI